MSRDLSSRYYIPSRRSILDTRNHLPTSVFSSYKTWVRGRRIARERSQKWPFRAGLRSPVSSGNYVGYTQSEDPVSGSVSSRFTTQTFPFTFYGSRWSVPISPLRSKSRERNRRDVQFRRREVANVCCGNVIRPPITLFRVQFVGTIPPHLHTTKTGETVGEGGKKPPSWG